MRPDRFAVYNYAHLPQRFKGQRMINAADIPSAEVKLDIFENTIERLTSAGYVYIGMDHFALPDDELVVARRNGTLQRNFQGYSTHRHCDLIGLGVSSIGSIGNMFAQSSTTTLEYEMLINKGTLPIRKGIVVDDDDQLRAAVIQSLMCYDELVYDDFNQQHDVDFRRYFGTEIKQLEALAKDQLVTLGDRGIRITAKGRLLLRNIAMTFDRYMRNDENESRFSKAI
jgi:oxygen-independent coproporphyrinogen-3 oxidase